MNVSDHVSVTSPTAVVWVERLMTPNVLGVVLKEECSSGNSERD